MTREIDDIRRDIDSVDRQLHDLLMKRADLADEIGLIKRQSKTRIIHPDREAALIRKVLSRHKGKFPQGAIIAVWRQIVGALSTIQGEALQIVVCCPEDNTQTGYVNLELAKNYFSSIIPVKRTSSPLGVLSMIRESEATFGILPWPEDGEGDEAWWRFMMDESGVHGLRVIGRLPFANIGSSDIQPEHRALVVAKIPFADSGDDHSFMVIDLESDVSRSFMVSEAEKCGFVPVSVYNSKSETQMTNFMLLESEGFIDEHDKRIEQLRTALGGIHTRVQVIGGYPVPPVLKS